MVNNFKIAPVTNIYVILRCPKIVAERQTMGALTPEYFKKFGRITVIGKQDVFYDKDNRMIGVGSKDVYYDFYTGKMSGIGKYDVAYDGHETDKIVSIGKDDVYYNEDGRIVSIGERDVLYQDENLPWISRSHI